MCMRSPKDYVYLLLCMSCELNMPHLNDEDKTLYGESAASFEKIVMHKYALIVNNYAALNLRRKT